MADPNGGDKESAAQLADVKAKLKAEGFATIGELVSAYQTACADRDKAAGARDKFNEANDEARVIIRTKGSEIGTLKQQVATLEAEVEALKQENENLKTGSNAQVTPANPGQQPPPPQSQPSEEEELRQIEASLTDEHKQFADTLLAAMSDEDAIRYTENTKARLEFLKGLKNDPHLKKFERPKSFFQKPEAPASTPTESEYDRLLKQLNVRRTPGGPSGAPGVTRTGVPSGAGQPKEADWLH